MNEPLVDGDLQTRPAAALYRILSRLAEIVPDSMDRSGLFSFLSYEFRILFNYDRFSIYLYDAEREFLNQFSDADGTVVEVFSNTRIAHNTVAWQAIQTRKPVVITDLASMPLGSGGGSSLARAGLNATVALPLLLNQDVIGTLHLSFVRQPEDFASMLRVLNTLAPVLSLVLFVVLTEERRARKEAQKAAQTDLEQGAAEVAESSLFDTPDMASVMSLARRVSKLHMPVMILGETGTGKTMMARWLHQHSPRHEANFVKVNCPSLASTLFESEMFGYVKGAFTGALGKRTGRIEMAQHGTLFLDEIGDLSPDMQSKLLQVLEENTFERVGESSPIRVDIRLISATNVDPKEALKDNRLRHDLFYRLASVILRLPPLRRRRKDIPLMANYFISRFARQWEIRPLRLSRGVMQELCAHDWPGNIRELRNIVSRLLLQSLEGAVTEQFVRDALHEWVAPASDAQPAPATENRQPESHGRHPAPPPPGHSPVITLEENERAHILNVLRLTGGRIAGPRGAARLLGIPRSTLQHKLRKLDIAVKERDD